MSTGDEEDAERTGNARLALLGHLEEAFQERLARHGPLFEDRPAEEEIILGRFHERVSPRCRCAMVRPL
jgi:hypothetical protein